METVNKIYIKRDFACNPNELFRYLIQPDLIAKWFGPKHTVVGAVSMDVRVNGSYSIELIKPDNKNFFIVGSYIEIDKPSRLVFSFQYQGLPSSPPESRVEITIKADGSGNSKLLLTQQFEVMPADMENRTVAWNNMLTKLGSLI